MRLLPICTLLLALAGLADTQTGPVAPTDRAELTADALTRTGSLLRGVGHVHARIGALVLAADEGTLASDTGDLELRGNATVTLPARSDRNLFRYDSQVVLTDAPVPIRADRLSVSNGVLRGSGHIQVKTDDALLQADEIEMLLGTGDGRASGNIRVNGKPLEPPSPAARAFEHVFPPDIIK